MHAAIADKAKQVQCGVGYFGAVDGAEKLRVCLKTSIAYGNIDALQFLVHDSPCAEIKMSHFRVAHLMGRQANKFFRSVKQSVRIVSPKLVPVGFAGGQNSVVIGIFTVAETVKNEQ